VIQETAETNVRILQYGSTIYPVDKVAQGWRATINLPSGKLVQITCSTIETLDQVVEDFFHNEEQEVSWFHRLCISFAEAFRFELANIWSYLFAFISLILVVMVAPLQSAFEVTSVFLLLVLIFKGNKIGS
jgi:hypothetical protein